MSFYLVILIAGIFLDFAAALVLLFPLFRFSVLLRSVSTLQEAILSLKSNTNTTDKTANRAQNEIMYEIEQDASNMEKLTKDSEKYEKDFFPYGIIFLIIGFILIVIGSLALNKDLQN